MSRFSEPCSKTGWRWPVAWAGFDGATCPPISLNHCNRGTIEVVNPNADPNVESGGGPFARGRAPASAMGVWRTPKDEEYANPEALVGRKVRVYFDGDCTYFEAQVINLSGFAGFGCCRFGYPAGVALQLVIYFWICLCALDSCSSMRRLVHVMPRAWVYASSRDVIGLRRSRRLLFGGTARLVRMPRDAVVLSL